VAGFSCSHYRRQRTRRRNKFYQARRWGAGFTENVVLPLVGCASSFARRNKGIRKKTSISCRTAHRLIPLFLFPSSEKIGTSSQFRNYANRLKKLIDAVPPNKVTSARFAQICQSRLDHEWQRVCQGHFAVIFGHTAAVNFGAVAYPGHR